jgi:hypothetical protein
VDPEFLQSYASNIFKADHYPHLWDLETETYVPNTVGNNPFRVFDNKDSDVVVVTPMLNIESSESFDDHCLEDYENVKVFLHYPTEVIPRLYFNVPFNASFTFLLNPKITRTSDSTRSYDPLV